MPAKDYHCWVWLDEARRLAYVFTGKCGTPERLWQFRFDYDTPLADWLLTLETPPALHDDRSFSTCWPSYGTHARALAREIGKRLKAEGFALLSNRDRKSFDGGKRVRRSVYVESKGRMIWFKSISSAARALGVDKSTLTKAAKNPNRLDVRYA